jgi:hypothetical protein
LADLGFGIKLTRRQSHLAGRAGRPVEGMSAKRRKEIAKKAAKTRWEQRNNDLVDKNRKISDKVAREAKQPDSRL